MGKVNYFNGCTTIDQVKSRYRELMMIHHPDHGGDVETAKAINSEMETVLNRVMTGHFTDWQDAGRDRPDVDMGPFADVIADIMDFNVHIEIIGFWVYVFESYEYREALKAMGFWFSKKHRAWIFSGGAKKRIRSRLTTDENRERLGYEVVRERRERQSIA